MSINNLIFQNLMSLQRMTITAMSVLLLQIVVFSHAALAEETKKGTKEMNQQSERYQRGWEKLKEIDGEAGEKVIESLKDIAPDLGKYIIEYPFGDVYARQGLDLKSREIATIAALTAMGDAKPQLKVHIQAGLNVGLTKTEIIETIIQMSVYAGFPRALNGITAAKEVFAENEVN